MAIAAVILGLAMPAILNYFLPDATFRQENAG